MSLTDVLSAASKRWSGPRDEAGILDPFTYIASHPGNGVREHLLSAFNLWMDVPQAEMEIIGKVVGMLHNASLMLDDIEDSSQLRRGKPAAHTVYGIPLTVNAATYIHVMVYQELSHLGSHRREYRDFITAVTGCIIEELGCLHYGQGLDIIWRDSFRCPTEAEYIDMVKNKTGGLLRIGVKLMMACSTANLDKDYVTLVDLIGVFYQIRDDYLNLRSPIYSANKGFAEDLEEGKFSFPIVHGVQANTSNPLILDVLKNRPAMLTLKTEVIQYLEHETKSFDYTVSVLDALQVQIGKEIQALGGNMELSTIMDVLHVDDQTLN
ncbi:isoprenoid synthase domain-containing protein [Mycena albidolilacea]|uniref:(2E,6E)-farnesyl diphosphate synthase n=1 Tax=Mycena albidolilacea TaxID=1033008 RepID=A0AAD7ETR2_9AGAR|nr:isoprenoid synthase domain-containing protein [Mycena albidolilacea]